MTSIRALRSMNFELSSDSARQYLISSAADPPAS